MADGSATSRAREVVGLYGDPRATWKIALELGVAEPVGHEAADARLEKLFAQWPSLGHAPAVEVVNDEGWEQECETLASAPNRDDDHLVDVLLAATGRRIFIVAHHGVTDGLGLVAIGSAVLGQPIVSHARGIGDRPSAESFMGSGVRRLREALLSPPPRFQSNHGALGNDGENLRRLIIARTDVGTAALCRALARVFATWKMLGRTSASGGSRPLFVIGASRREPGIHVPDRQTAYLRLRVDPSWDVSQVREALRETAPEPDFPATSAGGMGPILTGLLRQRLGSTAQATNLGFLESEGLTYAAVFAAVNGPRAVSVGVASTTTRTTLSVRTRRVEFSKADTEELMQRVLAELVQPHPEPTLGDS